MSFVPPARRTRRPLLALLALLLLLVIGYAVQAARPGSPHTPGPPASHGPAVTAAPRSSSSSGDTVALSALPPQAQSIVALIQSGGALPYSRDGIEFRNREGMLPRQRSGYYHEYTVPTPGEADRGPRRIITGLDGQFYYTPDHYATFRRVDVTR